MSRLRTSKNRGSLDWAAARARLDALVERHGALAPEQVRAILEERARALARVSDRQVERTPLELLHFELGREHYAIETRYVLRVIRPSEPTRLPGAPPQVRGITNLRGTILPVFDLRGLLGIDRTAPTSDSRWLVCGAASPELCLIADTIGEIVEAIEADLVPWGDANERWRRGVTRDGRSLIDGAALLEDPRLFVTNEADDVEATKEAAR